MDRARAIIMLGNDPRAKFGVKGEQGQIKAPKGNKAAADLLKECRAAGWS
jgi:hypothetical protein